MILIVLTCAVLPGPRYFLCMRFQLSFNFIKSKLNFSLCSLYYAEACNEFAGPSPHHCAQATLLLSKKCCSSSELLATMSDLTGPRFDLRLQRRTGYRSTNWPVIYQLLDQLAGHLTSFQVKLQLYYK